MKWLLGSMLALALVVAGYAMFRVVSLGSSWSSVERVSLDITTPNTQNVTSTNPSTTTGAWANSIRPEVPLAEGTTTTSEQPSSPPPPTIEPTTTVPPTTTPSTPAGQQLLAETESAPSVMALVGTDSRAGLDDTADFGDFPGRRADVIVLAIRQNEQLMLLSVPRDLYVADRCDGGHQRISAALRQCGDTNGLANLVRVLENLIGLDIQHVAAVDLAGFQGVIDAIGGYEICTDHPLRDRKSGLDIDAGCTVADGETTLQWLRSRYTERHVDGSWETVPGVSDLTRNERQRRFLADIFQRAGDRKDPRDILDILQSVAPHLTIDDQLSLRDAASWLWDYRTSNLELMEIPVAYRRTEEGASVLVPTVDVEDFVSSIPS